MISQAQAVTGRKPKRRYIDIINARTPYLPSLYAAKEAREYQDKTLALSREQLEEQTRQAEEALDLQKKQGREANTLGMINLGLTGGLGYLKNKTAKDIYAPAAGTAGGGGSPAPLGITPGVTPGTVISSPSIGSKIGGALTTPSTYGYGAAGYGAGKLFGGGDKTKSALIGGGVAAGLNLLSGGSITSSIISGLMGGGSAYAF